jgi:hypothetical protein
VEAAEEEAAEEAAVCVWMGGGVADVTHQKNASKAVTSGTDIQYEKQNKHTRVRVPVTRTKRESGAV